MTPVESMSSEEACHCLPPVRVDYTPKGKWVDNALGGCRSYVVEGRVSGRGKRALIYIYDIGGYCPQNFQGDPFASSPVAKTQAPTCSPAARSTSTSPTSSARRLST